MDDLTLDSMTQTVRFKVEHERLRSAVVERAKGWRFCEDKEVERFDFPEDAALAKAVDALNAFEASHTVEQKDSD